MRQIRCEGRLSRSGYAKISGVGNRVTPVMRPVWHGPTADWHARIVWDLCAVSARRKPTSISTNGTRASVAGPPAATPVMVIGSNNMVGSNSGDSSRDDSNNCYSSKGGSSDGSSRGDNRDDNKGGSSDGNRGGSNSGGDSKFAERQLW
jgi:hypothetical protein